MINKYAPAYILTVAAFFLSSCATGKVMAGTIPTSTKLPPARYTQTYTPPTSTSTPSGTSVASPTALTSPTITTEPGTGITDCIGFKEGDLKVDSYLHNGSWESVLKENDYFVHYIPSLTEVTSLTFIVNCGGKVLGKDKLELLVYDQYNNMTKLEALFINQVFERGGYQFEIGSDKYPDGHYYISVNNESMGPTPLLVLNLLDDTGN